MKQHEQESGGISPAKRISIEPQNLASTAGLHRKPPVFFTSLTRLQKTLAFCLSLMLTMSFLSFLPFGEAHAADSGSINATVSSSDGMVPGASVRITGPAGCAFSKTTGPQNGAEFSKLPAGKYSIRVSLPLGYELETITLNNGSAYPVSDNRSQADLALAAGEAIEVAFTCRHTQDSSFTSQDTVVNALDSLAAGEVKVEMQASPESHTGPFDIIIIVDYSGSMASDFNNEELTYNGVSNLDDPDYVAKNHPDSRYHALSDALRVFLNELTKKDEGQTEGRITGNIGFVFFSEDAQSKLFNGSYYTPIETFDVDRFIEVTMREEFWVGGGTRTDLAFAYAKDLMKDHFPAPDAGSDPRERKVLFFTDGEPGVVSLSFMEEAACDYRMPDHSAQSYVHNSYRMMAEVYNQADILKAPYGTKQTVNNAVEAPAPYPTRFTPFAEYSPYYDARFEFYGASIATERLGIDSSQRYDEVENGYYASEFTYRYNQALADGRLAELWLDRSAWKGEPDNNHDYLFHDLSAEPGIMYRKSSDPYPSNYASAKHGNFDRIDTGQGAEIYAVAIAKDIADTDSPQKIKRKQTVIDFLTHASGSDERVFLASSTEELSESFKSIFADFVESRENTYLRFAIDPDSCVFTATGEPIGADKNAPMWVDGGYLWVGPLSIRSDGNPLAAAEFVLYSRTICDSIGIYTRSAHDPQPEAIARGSLFKKNNDGSFAELETAKARVQTVEIKRY